MRAAVLVSGAATGIGYATAVRLAREGFTVFAGVRREADAQTLVREGGARVQPLEFDVADPDSVARVHRDRHLCRDETVRTGQQRRHRARGAAGTRTVRSTPRERVADAIVHALISPKPRAQYLTARSGRFQLPVARLPETIRDRPAAAALGASGVPPRVPRRRLGQPDGIAVTT